MTAVWADGGREGASGRGPVPAVPPILVAEDDPEARRMFARLLAKAGVVNPVEFAADGQAAIGHLAGVADGSLPTPVLILLDLNMPRRSGLDVLRWLRQRGILPLTPVVILTGSAEMDEVRECHDLGVASYLVKPVGFAALSDVLRGLELRWALLPPA